MDAEPPIGNHCWMRRLAFLAAHLAAATAAADTAVPSVPTESAKTPEEWKVRCAAELSSALADLSTRDQRFASVRVQTVSTTRPVPAFRTDMPRLLRHWVITRAPDRGSPEVDGVIVNVTTYIECDRCDDRWREHIRRQNPRRLHFAALRPPHWIIGSIESESPSEEFVREVVLARLERALDRCYEMRPRRR